MRKEKHQALRAAAAIAPCNGAWRYEFYACTELPGSVADLNPPIDDWQETY